MDDPIQRIVMKPTDKFRLLIRGDLKTLQQEHIVSYLDGRSFEIRWVDIPIVYEE